MASARTLPASNPRGIAPARPRAGRKRSRESHAAILDASLSVLEDRGFAGASIEAIAARAGVGKQTMYRWWPTRGAIFLEALRSRAQTEIRVPDSGSLELDLRQFLAKSFALLRGRYGALVAGLMAEAQIDAAFHEQFCTGLIDVRRAALRSIFAHAQHRGTVANNVDLDAIVDMVFGAMWYRLLLRHAELSDAFASQLARSAARIAESATRARSRRPVRD
jgi:AcrR family transcriptional regulator